jgi:hypothetical protein
MLRGCFFYAASLLIGNTQGIQNRGVAPPGFLLLDLILIPGKSIAGKQEKKSTEKH